MGLALGVLANVLGGSTYYLLKEALASWPPSVLILARVLVAAPLFAATMPRGWVARSTRADWARLFLIGLVGLAGPHLVGIYGLADTDSMTGAILIGVEPISIVVLSWIFLGDRLTARQSVAIAAAILGGALVVTGGDLARAVDLGRSVRGSALLAVHGVLWAVYTVAAKPTLARVPPRALAGVTTLLSLLAIAPAAALEWGELDLARALQPRSLVLVLALSLGITYGATVVWNAALRRLRPAQMASLIFLQPVTGALLGATRGERLGLASLAGAALILAAVFGVREPAARREA